MLGYILSITLPVTSKTYFNRTSKSCLRRFRLLSLPPVGVGHFIPCLPACLCSAHCVSCCLVFTSHYQAWRAHHRAWGAHYRAWRALHRAWCARTKRVRRCGAHSSFVYLSLHRDPPPRTSLPRRSAARPPGRGRGRGVHCSIDSRSTHARLRQAGRCVAAARHARPR